MIQTFNEDGQIIVNPQRFFGGFPDLDVEPLSDAVGFRATRNGNVFELFIEGARVSAPQQDEVGWLWPEIFPDVDARLVTRNSEFALQKIVKSKNGKHSFAMRTRGDLPDGFSLSKPLAIDNFEPGLKGFRLVMTGRAPIQKRSHLVETKERIEADRITHKILRDRAVYEDEFTHIPRYGPIEYPCRIHVLFDYTKVNDATDRPHIGQEEDDTTWGRNVHQGTVFPGQEGAGGGSNSIHSGLMWISVTVDQGATIDDATLSVLVTADTTDADEEVRIYGDAGLGQGVWSSTDRPSQFTKTSAFKDAGGVTPPATINYDVANIVQEIVDDAGWSNGDTMRFAFFDNTATSYDQITHNRAGNYGSTPFPRLVINWTAAGGGANPHNPIGHPLFGPFAGPIGY